MGIVWAILLFSLLVLVHEFGHFIAAKSFGVQVNEFALFMGPAIFKKKIGETEYSLRCIPFGGFCAMEGEDEDSDNPRAFTRASWWKRLIILVAGVTMNAILGIIMAILFLIPDETQVLPIVDHVESWSSVATENGLLPGDEILEIDGENIYIYDDIFLMLNLNSSDTHDLVVKRNGQTITLDDLPMVVQDDPENPGYQRYGITFTEANMDFGDKLSVGFWTAVDDVRTVRLSLKMLFNGSAGLKDMSGPAGIVAVVSDSTNQADGAMETFRLLMRIGTMLSMNLAVMNLLPIPALDGGRAVCLILTTVVEKITRKKIDPKYEGYLHAAGMILLLGFMAIITFKDIFMIFKR